MNTKTKKVVRIVCGIIAAMIVVPTILAIILY